MFHPSRIGSGETDIFQVSRVVSKGTMLRIDAKWGSVNEDSKITITGGDPSTVSSSKTDALPNDTITITGNGFGSHDLHTWKTSFRLDNTFR